MALNPYLSLPARSYWRSGVVDQAAAPSADYCSPKWPVSKQDRIATAGSCFAQHIGRRLKEEPYNVLDVEPAPDLLPMSRRMDYGYGIFSARYGNIYTARQLLQLAREAIGQRETSTEVWQKGDRYVDALRPNLEPEGYGTPDAVLAHRRHHLQWVRHLLRAADIFVFTLGLTETWENIETGQVYPVCPGTGAGEFDAGVYRFRNLTFQETFDDLVAFRSLLKETRAGLAQTRILLTVSPVPLTATASDRHVMQATVYSKSVLRAVAGQMTDQFDDVDYFPSYEIVANPWLDEHRYERNLRSVRESSVAIVMKTFVDVYAGKAGKPSSTEEDGSMTNTAAPLPRKKEIEVVADDMLVKCDEELLDAFGPSAR